MRNELALAGVLVVLGLSGASAQISTDAAVKSLTDQGFTNIEVDRDISDGELSVEGWRGEEKVEITYDSSTGAVKKTETETVRGGRAAEIAEDRLDDADDLNDRDDDRDDVNDRDDNRDDANDRDDDRDDANDRDDNDNDDNDRNDNDRDDNDNDRDDNDSDNDRDDD